MTEQEQIEDQAAWAIHGVTCKRCVGRTPICGGPNVRQRQQAAAVVLVTTPMIQGARMGFLPGLVNLLRSHDDDIARMQRMYEARRATR